jgi:hypothetical protein
MSNVRRAAKRRQAGSKDDLQDQITKLTGLTFEVTTALGKANDALAERVLKLENALKNAQAKNASKQGIITLGGNN